MSPSFFVVVLVVEEGVMKVTVLCRFNVMNFIIK